ncbi:hypothetical protein B0J11DRAFT_580300 [Dendryphion nanum]|uniref:Yeast cell wall synthesis Kre9/Knh1-like N-terminal domain-containing protein n=1 Tax=Dendryphion nanum TaxID=256645 RepID=A0A9P9DWH3_9PLEO|nr:hypothetical protein B0J11DRAFT_580300 [Dendryphion nanum]
MSHHYFLRLHRLYSIFLLVCTSVPVLSQVVASEPKIEKYPRVAKAGSKVKVTYRPADDTPVTFILQKGSEKKERLSATANGGKFVWDIDPSLESGNNYSLLLIRKDVVTSSERIRITEGGNGRGRSSTVMTSRTPTPESFTPTTTITKYDTSTAIKHDLSSATLSSLSMSFFPTNSPISTSTPNRTTTPVEKSQSLTPPPTLVSPPQHASNNNLSKGVGIGIGAVIGGLSLVISAFLAGAYLRRKRNLSPPDNETGHLDTPLGKIEMDGDGISEMSGASRQPELEGDRPVLKQLYSEPLPLLPQDLTGVTFSIEGADLMGGGMDGETGGGNVKGDREVERVSRGSSLDLEDARLTENPWVFRRSV